MQEERKKESAPAIYGEMGGSKCFRCNTNAMPQSSSPQTFHLPSPIPQWPQGVNLLYKGFSLISLNISL